MVGTIIVNILTMLLDTQKNLLVAFGLVIVDSILFYLLEGIIEREIKIRNAKILRSVFQHLGGLLEGEVY